MVKRRINKLRVKVALRETFKKKLVMSRLKWTSHGERMGDEKMAEIRCPESGRKMEVRKTENAMEGLC